MDEEEVFDLATISEYEVLSNDDGTALIQDNCVAIKHIETEAVKLLPLTDEVLQALGLAVVLDDENASQGEEGEGEGEAETEDYIIPEHEEEESQEEQKPETAAEHFTKFEVHDEPMAPEDKQDMEIDRENEVSVEYVYEAKPGQEVEYVYEENTDGTVAVADGSQEEQYVIGQKNEDGTITIVFTDEEDAEMNKVSQEINQSELEADRTQDDSHNLSGHESETKDAIYPQLVWNNNMVLRLLELYARHQRHFYNPTTRHRRVWRVMYDEMTRAFPRMRSCSEKHLQSKFASLKRTYKGALDYYKDNLHLTNWKFFDPMHKLMQAGAKLEEEARRNAPTVSNMPLASPAAHRNDTWQKPWTVLLLDVYEESQAEARAPHFWPELRERLLAAEPDLARYSADQLAARVAQLKRKFRQRKTAFGFRDAMDKTIYERLANIHRLESGGGGQQQTTLDTTVHANSDVTSKWSKSATTLLLDLYRQQRARLAAAPAAAVYAGLARAVSRRAAAPVSADACMQRVADMRRKYRALQKAGPAVPWIYFKACKAAFGAHDQDWSPANTALLLQLYEEALRTRRESSPGFWAGVALELHRLRPGLDVSESKCQDKMSSLVQRYRALQQRPPEEADKWPFYKQLQRIHGAKPSPWSAAATDALLDAYAARAARLDAGEDSVRLWKEISSSAGLPPDACRRKLQEMREQFCQIMREGGPAKNAPFYKRMNEIFSPHLWSKPNVRLLLDVVAPHRAAAGRTEPPPPPALWERIADTFNRCTHSSAVIGSQCQAQLRLLQAKYRALLNESEEKQAEWPFFQRMHELFGDYVLTDAPPARRDARCVVDEERVDDKVYYWSHANISALLDAYDAHRGRFASQPRKAVWRRVDRALARADPHYRAHKTGYGAWFKYLDLLTKFMDIKEGRCAERDWPFYERMNEIFTTKPPAPREPGGSDDEDASGAESACDALEELLAERGKRPRGESETSLSTSDVADNTRSKRKKLSESSPAWGEEETHALIDVYAKHRARLAPAAAAAAVWADVAQDLHSLLGTSDRTAAQCEERVQQLRRQYRREQQAEGAPPGRRLSDSVTKKLAKLMKDEPAPAVLANGDGDGDVLSRLLAELRRRTALLARHEAARARRHAAALAALARVEAALRALAPAAAADQTDLFRDLEKTLAEIHK